MTERREAPGLHRGLGRFDAVAMTVNSVVGAGVFAMPAGLAAASGRWSLAIVLAGCAVVALFALAMAEVSSRFDATGGPQYYAYYTFGSLAGFAVGWLSVVSRFAAYAAIVHVMLDYAAALWPALGAAWPRIAAITIFTFLIVAVNLRGVTQSAWVGNLLTLAKFIPLALVALAGLWFLGWDDLPTAPPRQPGGLTDGLLAVLFACFGFEVAAIVAGEARDARRDLPSGILLGLGACCLLYLLLMLACFAVLADTASTELPLADAARALFGPAGGTLMLVTAVVSCAGGAAVTMLVSPRNLFALGESGEFPRAFASVHASWRTPHVAIAVNGAVCWLLAVTGAFEFLVKLFVISRILAYGSTAAALLVLRRREGPAPLPVPGGAWIAVASLACCVAIVFTTDWLAVRDVAIALAAGLVLRALTRARLSGRPP